MERTWACFDCRFDGAEPICCNADGGFDPERLARILLKIPLPGGESGEAKLSRMQAYDCVDEMVQVAPDAAIAFILAALDVCQTREHVALLGAGSLETLLKYHGPKAIVPLEQAARQHPKVRYLLSSTWGQSSISPAVWRRLRAAIAGGPVMDADPRTPAEGLAHLVISGKDIERLLAMPMAKDAVE